MPGEEKAARRVDAGRSGFLRVERDGVAFGVGDEGPETVGTDGVFFLDDASAAGACGIEGGVEAAVDGEIDERSVLGGRAAAHDGEAAGDGIAGMREQAELLSGSGGFDFDGLSEDGGVKGNGPFEVDDGDIDPADEVVGHGLPLRDG